ncbi:hypothetical protein THARTR1_07511 [Trichoderma harzianum]|uniref:Uncharacterized protein n=1 Tax=Trichoderma harzianum TaxID=5544 RepID=A0A2K0U1T3_TRIHA|nr:hypothetical protein THARTR1_07511 [Trichoderma harzianum]
MSHETRQPTTVIEMTQPWSAAWSGRHRNDQEITRKITAAHEDTAFNIVKQWQDTRSVSIGSRAETIHPEGYERVITIVSHTRNPDYTKTKKDWSGRSSFNWQGSGSVTFKVDSFAEKQPE